MSKINSRINIESSIYLATQDFKIVGDIDYGDRSGMCVEGHSIRYGVEIEDQNGNIYVFGNVCVAKPFILKFWKLEPKMLDDENVIKAGRYLYIIAKDGLRDYMNEVPTPEDLNWDFKKLKEKLREIVSKAKKEKSKHLKILSRDLVEKVKMEKFKKTHKLQFELVQKLLDKLKSLKERDLLFLLNNWEREFVISVISQHRSMRIFSERQVNIIEKIISKRDDTEDLDEEISSKLTKAISILDKLSEKEREYIMSFQSQFYSKGSLSDKQLNLLDNLINRDFDIYVGRELSEWITKQKTDINGHGKIISVEAKTEKAILCQFVINDMEYKSWIPLSQLK